MEDDKKDNKPDPVVVTIDMEEIYAKIEKYIYKKMQDNLRDEIIDDVLDDVNVDISNRLERITVPDIAGRIEKIEDWIQDIEQGWSKLERKKK